MKHIRVRKVLTGVFCGICLVGIAIFTVTACILSYSLANSGQGNSLNLFGYTVFLNDPNNPLGYYPPGTAIVTENVPHDTLQPGDLVVCRDLDVENQFYPVIRIVFFFDPEQPSTITVETISDQQILTVNRDDVIGKCIFSSAFLGKILNLLQNQERGTSILALIITGLAVLFAGCLLWYLLLAYRAKKQASLYLPPDETPSNLLELIETEDVPLEKVSPQKEIGSPSANEEEPLSKEAVQFDTVDQDVSIEKEKEKAL